jgi:tellurite methyltransferase
MAQPASKITGFHQDAAGDWVAELACGHTQHVRHRPPWELRAWVTSEAGRSERIGRDLECPACRMPRLPAGLAEFKRTAEFSSDAVPAGLLKTHRLPAATWAEIVVLAGHLRYVLEDDGGFAITLHSGLHGVVAPERPHHVEPLPGVRFHVRFLR